MTRSNLKASIPNHPPATPPCGLNPTATCRVKSETPQSHRTKLVLGSDDPSTLELFGRLTGGEHVGRRGWSAETMGGRRTVSESESVEDLAPAHVVRQMRPGDAMMLHGTLPPAHVRALRWYEEKFLAELVPCDDEGWPLPAQVVDTCPLSGEVSGPLTELVSPVEDATLLEALAHLPRRRRGDPGASGVAPAPPGAAGPTVDHAEVAADDEGFLAAKPNRYAKPCWSCGTEVPKGKGQVSRVDDDWRVLCALCLPGAQQELAL